MTHLRDWVLALICCFGIGWPTAGTAATSLARTNSSFIIDVWNTEDGLPQNEVTSILQGADGYLWLGTPSSGLVRFDGTRFTVFDESNTRGLESSRVVSLFEDRQRSLWMGTATAGVVLIKDGKASSLGIGQGREARLAAACEDATGAVWLYLANGQLWRYARGQTNMFEVGTKKVSDYRGIVADKSGQVIIGMDGGLSSLQWKGAPGASAIALELILPVTKLNYLLASKQGGYWTLGDLRVQKWKDNHIEHDWGWFPWELTRVYAACEDQDGNLIVGTLGAGVFWFNAKGEHTRISTSQGLSNDYIFSLYVDLEGDLWVGTDGGGLNRVKRPVFDVLEPTRGLVVQSVCGDSKGGLWIGCNEAPLAYYKDGVVQPLRLPTIPARSVLVDRQQRVWMGALRQAGPGLFEVLGNTPEEVAGFDRSLEFVSAIHQDRRGWLWVGTGRGLARWDQQDWKTFTTTNGLSADVVQAIADDPDGNLWIGMAEGGLNRLRDGQFTAFRRQKDGLPSNNVSSLYVDGEGVLWIGTDGGGLARLHQGKWARYTRADGLVSNSIGYIIEDDQGYLWLGSNAGLMRASRKTLNDFAAGTTNFVACRVYGRPEGLPVRECTSGSQPGPCRTQDGRLWFPTIKGLVSVDPADLKPNSNPPPVRIEAVLVDGQPEQENLLRAGPARTIYVPAGKEHIEIQYSSLNLAAPDRARFKYRLEGHETDWVEAGTSRVAPYSKLPPGSYQFHVIACNEDGFWNQVGATVGFSIAPHFWRTWWFLSGTAGCLLASVTGVVHYLSTQRLQRQVLALRQQEALEKERSRIARDIHDQLGASLTQVALLGELVESDKDSPVEVEAHAQQISQTARDTTRVLDEIVWAVNPANDTLDGLMTYICKYTQEYLNVAGLHYRLDVPGQLPTWVIPPEVRHNVFLACKEAVTNVVRHAHASAVWVRLRVQPGTCVLEIEDNGRGLASGNEKANRNGLHNMRKRMEEIGGAFAFAPAPDGGTIVRFTVPLGEK